MYTKVDYSPVDPDRGGPDGTQVGECSTSFCEYYRLLCHQKYKNIKKLTPIIATHRSLTLQYYFKNMNKNILP